MNRTLKGIKNDTWYHKETLKKFYKYWKVQEYAGMDNKGKKFNFVTYKSAFGMKQFIEHPKTKRLARLSDSILAEIGYEL